MNLPSTRKSHLVRPQIQYCRHRGLDKNRRECSGRWKGQGSSPSDITIKSIVSLPERYPSRQTAKDPKNMKRPVSKGFTLITRQRTEDFRKIHSFCIDLSIIYKLIDQESLLFVDLTDQYFIISSRRIFNVRRSINLVSRATINWINLSNLKHHDDVRWSLITIRKERPEKWEKLNDIHQK